MAYEVFAEFPIEQVLPFISTDGKKRVQYGGFDIRVGSTRLQTMGRSQRCVCCGREGVVFRLERTQRWKGCKIRERDSEYRTNPHFNLYTIEFIKVKDGSNRRRRKYVLMTRDHIFPRSRGGKDTLDNSQTMCERCNSRKSDKLDTKYILQEPVQKMLKLIPVHFPLMKRYEPCVNF